MEDPGPPSSYLTLAEGTPVYASGGEPVGKVANVLAATDADVFDGVVVDLDVEPGGARFVDAPEVGAIHERAVQLTLDLDAVSRLPAPSANPAAVRVDPADAGSSGLEDKLRRAWDLISGRY